MGELPRMVRVRQIWQRPRIADVAATVAAQLERLELGAKVRAGQTVAITAGSRGIAQIAVILRAVVTHLRGLGAEPFLVPAMGSHGGGTAAGQQRVLESYGITEAFCGCPIRSSMETLVVAQAEQGFPIHFDRLAHEADHVLVCGRIKPHTMLAGRIQSGLLKMLLIGLGKQNGAQICHRAMLDYGFDAFAPGAARRVVRECRVLAGLAVLENAYDEVAQLVALRPEEFESREPELLRQAGEWMPRLPFDKVDVLLIDEIGKNISGAGLDTNVVGRKFNDHAAAPDEVPKVRRIVVRGMSAATHGNAIGIGMTEFCKTSLIEQMDRQATWLNGLVAGHVSAAMQPLHFPTDRELLDAALSTLGLVEPPNARVMWIKNTLDLGELACSTAYLKEADGRRDLEIVTPPADFPLDPAGNLPASGVDGSFRPCHE
jgi:hypothetical protein